MPFPAGESLGRVNEACKTYAGFLQENPDHGSCNKNYARRFLRLKLCIVVQSATSELTATTLLACPSSASLCRCRPELTPPTQPAERYSLFFAEIHLDYIQHSKQGIRESSFCSIKGTDVVIVKNGRRICGTGGCLANAPLHQNKSYFEFKIQSTGIWGIGVATQKANLNQIPLGRDVHSLVMRNDGALYYNNEEKNRLPANNLPQEGDVVGITYDHVELNVYLNGKNMHCPASGIRGTVYPVVYVDDSAILDCQFSEFYHTPPPGFEKILFEQQIF
ncbi:PREDICTED: SPRY domain-containing protein 7 [Corvus brachyrhynchos]|uniref:SPRY domain-containing protein 7 n=1 Tax=Corvus brachyrhynchos TaxID=85066 RepID=UPI00081638FB|nr:PREDICTED: SPRY domain-containing protein 7 [Corvus brachyrhynchos]